MTAQSDLDKPADPEDRLATVEGPERAVWEALRTVEDPELPVSIVDLGLVYDVFVDDQRAELKLTLTYSGCPGREMIISDAEAAVLGTTDIESVDIQLVYSPPWNAERITDRGQKALREFGLAVPGAEDQPDPDCHN